MADGGGSYRAGGHSSTLPSTSSQVAGGRRELKGWSRRPRSLCLRRCENGFGFTLRHFIVYPPESYSVLQGDQHLRLQHGNRGAALDEPMDTIFVKNVFENSPAHAAGLATGDRIITVNGLAVTGYSYAQVVQQIQQSGNFLHLLVVPKEDDLLQLYFGETAHNPETNQRPLRFRSPTHRMLEQNQQQHSQHQLGSQHPTFLSPQLYRSGDLEGSNRHTGKPRRSSEGHSPFYSGHRSTPLSSNWGFHQDFIPGPCNGKLQQKSLESCSSTDSMLPGVYYPSSAGCRLSLDGGRRESSISLPSNSITDSKDSLYGSNSTLRDGCSSDDSIIMSRIRKSCEQKEEFLRRPNQPIAWNMIDNVNRQTVPQSKSSHPQAVIAREFYARPQKFQRPLWPPLNSTSPESSMGYRQQSPSRNSISNQGNHNMMPMSQVHPSFRRMQSDTDSEHDMLIQRIDYSCDSNKRLNFERASSEPCESQNRTKYVPTSGSSIVSVGSLESNSLADQASQQTARSCLGVRSPFVSTLSRIHENIPTVLGNDVTEDHPSSLCVSHRARQFEKGLVQDDKTSLHCSELALLSAKKSVPNVAVRRQEFESRSSTRESRRTSRESRSLESSASAPKKIDEVYNSSLSGNRIIPIGGSKLHCDPPCEFDQLRANPDPPSSNNREPAVRLRTRSNSAESWAAAARNRITSPQQWEEQPRHRAVRQDSYLAAVRTPLGTERPSRFLKRQAVQSVENDETATRNFILPNTSNVHTPIRPSQLDIPSTVCLLQSEIVQADTSHSSPSPTPVIRRQKHVEIPGDEERHARRVSYLKATLGDRMHMDTDVELSDNEGKVSAEEQDTNETTQLPHMDNKENDNHIREGSLWFKETLVDGKRSQDRSWHQFWAVLRATGLTLYRTSVTNEEEAPISLKGSTVEVAAGYTKRKHVLRLSSPNGSELLIQTEDDVSMGNWLQDLQDQAAAQSEDECLKSQQTSNNHLSPIPPHKGIRKFTSFRNRSPTGQSPVNKTRKPSQSDQLPSPKSTTWRGRVARQLRKIQQGSASPNSPTSTHPEGATIGIPLEECPQSKNLEFVPLLVEMCTSIVDARGLDIIGIYRVPGNTAAVTSLTESINKGFDWTSMQDPRWNDVNVISSLLKLFFRRLPDPLLTNELYPSFIEADKTEDANERFIRIRKLVHELPDHHYETLKFLMFHLKKVVAHSDSNKMQARNLAIVFGPTLVRTADDNMETMVKHMSHQCRVVESLILQVDWFFSEDYFDDPNSMPNNIPEDANELESNNQSLLLSNIQKVEGMKTDTPNRDISAKDIVSSIISAANRKMQKAKSRKTTGNAGISAAEDTREAYSEKQALEEKSNTTETKSSDETQQCLSTQTSNVVVDDLNSLQQNEEHHFPTKDEIIQEKSERNIHSPNIHDEATWTYSGLLATTQERIRKFELETRAMLQRDQTRQRHEQERREAEKLRIEAEWQQAKRELEADDPLDSLADNPSNISQSVCADKNSNLTITKSSKQSAAAAAVVCRTIEQQSAADSAPSSHFPNKDKTSSKTENKKVVSLSQSGKNSNLKETREERKSFDSKTENYDIGPYFDMIGSVNSAENMCSSKETSKKEPFNFMLKRLKTGKEAVSVPLGTSVRCSSLDSLHEVHISDHLQSDLSDDESDLLKSFTSTFDAKLKSLLNASHLLEEEDKNMFQNPHNVEHSLSKESTSNASPERVTINNKITEFSEEKGFPSEKKVVLSNINFITFNEKADKNDSDRIALNFKQVDKSVSSGKTKLKRSESLTRPEKTEVSFTSKLKRSESLSKAEKMSNFNALRLKRSESLTKAEKSDSFVSVKFKNNDSLTKNEKTESNNTKRKQDLRTSRVYSREKENIAILAKLKRKNGMPERSIKRRHTVGGTKDFDKLHWLDNRLQYSNQQKEEKEDKERQTSSPELRCHSLPDPTPPLESHI